MLKQEPLKLSCKGCGCCFIIIINCLQVKMSFSQKCPDLRPARQYLGCYLHFSFQRSLQWYKTMLMLFKYVLKSVLHMPKC